MHELDPWHYLIVMGACLAITAPLEFAGARVYRRPRRTVSAIAPAAFIFFSWDVIAIGAGVWWFNPRFVTGVTLVPNIPVEELMFFLVIPLCALLTYNTLERFFQREPGLRGRNTRHGVKR